MPDELKEKIKEKQRKLRVLTDKNEDLLNGDRSVPEGKRDEFDQRADDIDELQADIKRLQKHRKQKQFNESPESDELKDKVAEGEARREQVRKDGSYAEAFVEYVQKGRHRMSREAVDKLYEGEVRYENEDGEVRAMSTEVDDQGGFAIPQDFADGIEVARKRFGGMMQANTTVRTTDGVGDIPIPTSDDTSNKGEFLSENESASEQDISTGRVVLGAYVLSSKIVKASVPLLRSSIENMSNFIEDRLGERFGRRENEAYTVGDGVKKPHGVITAATKGTDAGTATAVDEDDIFSLKHSVDPAYREEAQFMCHDSMLREIKTIKDANDRPLFMQDFRTGNEPILDGDEVVINQNMVDVSSGLSDGQKSLAYGNFRKYWIRQVRTLSLLRLEERYAENWQVGFVGFMQVDGNLLDAGTNPIQYLEQ